MEAVLSQQVFVRAEAIAAARTERTAEAIANTGLPAIYEEQMLVNLTFELANVMLEHLTEVEDAGRRGIGTIQNFNVIFYEMKRLKFRLDAIHTQ